MLFKSLVFAVSLVIPVLGLQDCCYEYFTDGGSVCLDALHTSFQLHKRSKLTFYASLQSLKYRSNALDGVFYDIPQNQTDGSGSFCGVQITR